MKSIIVLGFISLYPFISVFAQTDEFRQAYQQFRKNAITEYRSFRDKANAEYAEWMKQAWELHKALPPMPKPEDDSIAPVVYEGDRDDFEDRLLQADVIPEPVVNPQPLPHEPIREVPVEKPTYSTFGFYGLDCKVRFDNTQKYHLKSLDNETIADQWNVMAGESYNNTIRDCLEFRIRHNLCDWAFIQFLDKLSTACVGNGNEKALMMAYILCQTGYKIRLGKSDSSLYLLYASPHYIFDIAPFDIDGEYFYGYNCPENEIEIYNFSFPYEQTLSLWIDKEQQLGNEMSGQREILSVQFPDLKLSSSVNKHLIDFYNSYPTSAVNNDIMTRWAMYANTPMSQPVKTSVYEQLKESIQGKTQLEAVNMILNWVQTGFEYEFDDKVWGHDRAFFAEESLYYPYCDCEDRSILFSRIIRDLIGLDIMLVFYPGHLATAVCFNEDVKGDYILLNDKKFIVCDPTYIGAPVGLTMPGMDNLTAQVILLKR